MPLESRNLACLLHAQAARHPGRTVIHFLKDGETTGATLTFTELWARSSGISRRLREQFDVGERIGILHEAPHEFLCSFFGCQLGGFIAVPLPATGRRTQQQIRSAAYLTDAEAVAVLTDERGQAKLPSLPSCELILADTVRADSSSSSVQLEVADTVPAYLQYTSGSTGSPKGVCISHANIMANLGQITERLNLAPGVSIVSWLPHHHDQGLVGSLLLSIFLAGTCHVMTPASFVARPLRWLEVISRYRGHLAGGPNFAFDYCIRAARQAQEPLQLDLSAWRVAFNGAERIFPETVRDFTDCFAPHGFHPSAWSPSYGLAEATLAVSMVRPLPKSAAGEVLTVEHDGAQHVACGPPMAGTQINIADADTGEPRAEGELGEIWLRGPSIAARYWKQAMPVVEVQAGEPYLRTGDFGFLRGGNLFVVGRREDRFKVRGRNVFAADLERACRGADVSIVDCAAFVTALDVAPRLAVELRRTAVGRANLANLAEAIANAVYEELDLAPAAIHFVRQGALPRTTSGKLRRCECAALILSSHLECLGVYTSTQGSTHAGQVVQDPLVRNVRALLHSLELDELAEVDVDAVIRLDSVDQLRVQHALQTTFGVRMGAGSSFNTLRALCEMIEAGGEPGATADSGPIPCEQALTSLQQDILLADRVCGSALFTVGCVIRVQGRVSRASLMTAVQKLLDRHWLLRCGLVESRPGEFVLRPAAGTPIVEQVDTLEGWPGAPIPLGAGWLVRFGLCHERDASAVLVAAHHLLADHGSVTQLAQELQTLCRAPLTRLPAAGLYRSFAEAHARGARSRQAQSQTFWKTRLQHVVDPPPLNGMARGPINDWRVSYVSRDLPRSVLQAVVECSRAADATLSSVVLASYGLLVMRCTGASETVVSCATTLREGGDFAATVGYMVNSVPVIVRGGDAACFSDLCRIVREELDQTKRHADYAQHLIGRELPAREAGEPVSPLTRYVFNFLDERSTAPTVRSLPSHPLAELQLTVRLQSQSMRIEVSALAERYDPEFLEQIAESLTHLLSSATRDASRPLRSVGIVSAGQAARLKSFDGPQVATGRWRLDEWIGSIAARSADRVAVIAFLEEGVWEHLTYSAMMERAAAVAASLPPVRGAPVAIALEHSIEQIVATLGVLRAGAVYMPLDPQLPTRRMLSMLEDAGAGCVLTDAANLPRLRDAGVPARILDYGKSTRVRLLAEPSDQEGATLIYTSGSSGRPKGVLLAHSVYAARLLAMQRELGIGTEDVFIQKTSISFDVSLWEIFLPLVSGARLVMAPRTASFDPRLLTSILEAGGVSIVHFVPTMLREWLAGGEPGRVAPHLQRCLCSGEALRAEDRDRFALTLPNTQLVNLYGPTECGIDVTWSTELGDHGEPPIGRPTLGSRIGIVSDYQAVPPGVPGQLTIAGPQLAMGYWGRPDLTAARFIPAEDGKAGERAYLSGDHAVWRPDAQLTYLGRMDGQVKVRGVRIEVNEVRHAILSHPQAEQAEVLVLSQSGGYALAAAVVSRQSLTPAQVHEYLFERLPASAVPTLIQILPSLPVLPNGKCDLDGLRAAFTTVPAGSAPSVSPVVGAVAQAWEVVLGVPPLKGARFFAYGGDSVKAIRLVNELANRGIPASVADIYRWQSIEEQSRRFLPAPSESVSEPEYASFSLLPAKARESLDLAGLDDAYPLSQLQRTVVMQSFGEARYETYVSGVRVRGAFVRTAFQAAVSRLMHVHPFLRSSFDLTRASEPLQLVHKAAAPPIEVRDLRELDETAARQALEEWTRLELRNVFRWDEAPLLRFTVHLLRDEQFVISMTDAALDGWCVALVFRDIVASYDAFLAGGAPGAVPVLPSYGVFVKLERDAIASAATRQYWQQTVKTLLPQQCPRWAAPRARQRSHRRAEIPVPKDTVARLQAFAASRGYSLKPVFFALCSVMLAVLRENTAVLAMIECNGRPECEGGDAIVGVFNNILPVQVSVADRTWAQLAAALYEIEAQFQPHRRLPISEVLREFGGRSMGDVLFVFTRFHVLDELQKLERVEVLDAWASDETYLPLTFHVNDSSWHGVRILLDYDASDFPPAQNEWLTRWLRDTLAQLPDAMDTPCLPAGGSKNEMTRLLWGESRAASDCVLEECRRRPAATAMVEGDRSITYRELQHRAAALGRKIVEHEVCPGENIGLVADAGIDAACAMLGAWLIGVGCVLLDPAQPRKRLEAQLVGCGVKLALVQEDAWDLIDGEVISRLRLPGPMQAEPGAATDELTPRLLHPQQTAYILHTSGSSGTPKPVAVPHCALSNYIANALALYGIAPGQRVWSHSSIGFDFTLTTLIAPLCAGAVVHITSRHDFSALLRQAESADVIKLTPTHLQLLQRHPDVTPGRLPTRIIVGGELLYTDAVRALQRVNPALRIFNEYGPTEACVGCSVQECDGGEGYAVEGIGESIEGMQVHLLDGNLAPIMASNVPGELYLSGIGLAAGYSGHANLTSERFVPCPFGMAGSLMYRTGDAAKYVDGRLVCIGRVDRQVKVRGHRVELGEIESCLTACPEVSYAAAAVRGGRLVAWILPRQPLDTIRLHRIRLHLESHLPEYMRPERVYEMTGVPLTRHGKLDGEALREVGEPLVLPGIGQVERIRPTLALIEDPRRRQWQDLLAAIWAEVLEITAVGAGDNYFRLGGNSVSSILITAKARAAGIPLTTRLLLENATLEDLVNALLRADALETTPAAQPRERGDEAIYPLTPMQTGILHDCLLAPQEALYESHLVLEIAGPVDPALLSLAWSQTFRANDVLRNRFITRADGVPVQTTDDTADCELVVVDCRAEPGRAQGALQRLKARFSERCGRLDRAPLCGLGLVSIAADRSLLLMTHHHLILDGWSQQLVLQELFDTYAAYRAGLEAPYVARTAFHRYVAHTRAQSSDPAFWRDYLDGAPVGATLTRQSDDRHIATRVMAISTEVWSRLTSRGQEWGVTLATLIQAGWALAWAAVARTDDVVYGLTMSGRDTSARSGEDFSDVVGMCINTLPVRARLPAGQSVQLWLQHQQRSIRAVMAHEHDALSGIQRAASPGGTASTLFESIVVMENLPTPREREPRLNVVGFEIKEGMPIVLVVFFGREPRIQMRVQPGRCLPGVLDRLSRKLSLALESLGSATASTPVGALLNGLEGRSTARATPLTAFARTPL